MIPKCYQVPSSEALESSYAMLAPFNHLLTTNEPPSPEDVHNLKSYLSYPKNRIVEIRRRVALLHIELAALNAERDTMGERYLTPQHEAILSSVRRLPTSVLQTIFVYGVLAAESIMETHSIIIVLSRVCRRWRTVVLQTPALHATALSMSTKEDSVSRASTGTVNRHGARNPRNVSIAIQASASGRAISIDDVNIHNYSTPATPPGKAEVVKTFRSVLHQIEARSAMQPTPSPKMSRPVPAPSQPSSGNDAPSSQARAAPRQLVLRPQRVRDSLKMRRPNLAELFPLPAPSQSSSGSDAPSSQARPALRQLVLQPQSTVKAQTRLESSTDQRATTPNGRAASEMPSAPQKISPRLSSHPPPTNMPPPPMQPPMQPWGQYYYPAPMEGQPYAAFGYSGWYMPQPGQMPPQQPPPGPHLPPHNGMPVSPRNPPMSMQGPGTSTPPHAVPDSDHPPPAMSYSSSGSIASPPPTPTTNGRAAYNPNANSFVPRTKISLKKADGTEVNLENFKYHSPAHSAGSLPSPAPASPNPCSAIRTETEGARKKQIEKEEQKKRKAKQRAADKVRKEEKEKAEKI